MIDGIGYYVKENLEILGFFFEEFSMQTVEYPRHRFNAPSVTTRLVTRTVGASIGRFALVGNLRPIVGHAHQALAFHRE